MRAKKRGDVSPHKNQAKPTQIGYVGYVDNFRWLVEKKI
jgi:hypothetical protein